MSLYEEVKNARLTVRHLRGQIQRQRQQKRELIRLQEKAAKLREQLNRETPLSDRDLYAREY